MKVTQIAERIFILMIKVELKTMTFNDLLELENLLSESHNVIQKALENETKIRKQKSKDPLK